MLASVRPLRTETLSELRVYVTGLALHKMAACGGREGVREEEHRGRGREEDNGEGRSEGGKERKP